MLRSLLLLGLVAILLPLSAAAQHVPALTVPEPILPAPRDSARDGASAAAVAASLVVPGAGQWLQGNSRWVPYVALEIWSWLRFRERRQESRELTGRYRDLAWLVARRVCGCVRRDTVFEYYEAMAEPRFRRSGLWDADEGQDGVQPEVDPGTFNGDIWALARGLFFPGGTDYPPGSAQYQAALDYYRQRAIPDDYAWAWAEGAEQAVFADYIEQSDDAYRDGTRMLGVVLANHVASVVDALVTAKLRALAPGRAEFRSGLAPEPAGARLQAELQIHF